MEKDVTVQDQTGIEQPIEPLDEEEKVVKEWSSIPINKKLKKKWSQDMIELASKLKKKQTWGSFLDWIDNKVFGGEKE